MKTHTLFLALIAALCASCATKQETPIFKLHNAIDMSREEVVVFTKSQVLDKLPSLTSEQVPVFKTKEGDLIPYQLDDLDGDGNWDEAALVIDFKPLAHQDAYVYAFAKAEQPQFAKMTDVHFGVGKAKPVTTEVQEYWRSNDPRAIDSLFFQMEGPAWENDKVGFRIYFDPRNGIDIFGKTTTVPTLHKQGLNTDYHKQAAWGMDILKVGTSLGAGSIAIKYNDSLYRVTGAKAARFKTVTEGPARAIFTLTFDEEQIAAIPVKVVHTVTIEKGDWFYKSDVSLYGQDPAMELVTGIVDLKPNEFSNDLQADTMFIARSYGMQSENDDNLGMAIIVPKSDVLLSAAPTSGGDITQTHLVNLKAGDKHTFYFMSGWAPSDPQFRLSTGFKVATINAATMIANPIKIQ